MKADIFKSVQVNFTALDRLLYKATLVMQEKFQPTHFSTLSFFLSFFMRKLMSPNRIIPQQLYFLAVLSSAPFFVFNQIPNSFFSIFFSFCCTALMIMKHRTPLKKVFSLFERVSSLSKCLSRLQSLERILARNGFFLMPLTSFFFFFSNPTNAHIFFFLFFLPTLF